LAADAAREENEVLDLRGLKCPLPALFARRALLRTSLGTVIVVRTDDPMARIDIPHMCHQEGFEVLGIQETEGAIEATLRRPSPQP
jgi:tRNA 2-thiouridine synthesizing protein A